MSATAAVRPQPPPAPPRRPRRLISAAALPGVLALATGVVLGPLHGGFPPGTWYPAALFLLALAVITVVVAPPQRSERAGTFYLALLAYGGFCAWSFASIAWADSKGDAWDGANRTLLYGIVLALIGTRPWTRRSTATALGVVAFGTALTAAIVLIVSAVRSSPAGLFLDGRLSDPIGYANATADLWMIGFWPALQLARTKTIPWGVRALAAGSASLLIETAVLSQSRGALIGFVASAIVFLLAVPRRGSAALSAAAILALVAASWHTLVGVHKASTAAGIGPALADARMAIFLSVLAAAAGTAVAIAAARDRRWHELIARPGARRAGVWAGRAAVAAGVVVVAFAVGNPVTWSKDRWHDFRYSGYEKVDSNGSRFTASLGSDRYDYYRVALDEFVNHPVQGIGADNFSSAYLQHRRGNESPRYPHSLAFRTLSQLGVVGAALFVAFLWLAVRAVRRCLRAPDRAVAGLAAAALAGFAMWFFHGMGDWLFEFPALGILGLGLLALGARAEGDPAPIDPTEASARALESPYEQRSPLHGTAWTWQRRAALGTAALVVAASLAVPGIAARYTAAAYSDYRHDPAKTLARLERAAQLDFLSAEPLLAKGVIAERLGQPSVARSALNRALKREPTNWFAHFELALLDASTGQMAAAGASLDRASALNPRQPLIREVRADLAAGRPVNAEAVEQQLYGQVRSRLTSTQQGRR